MYLDGGQMFMMMQMAEKMETQKLTDNERKWGEMVTESMVDKGVTTRTFNKRYWKQFFSFEGMRNREKVHYQCFGRLQRQRRTLHGNLFVGGSP